MCIFQNSEVGKRLYSACIDSILEAGMEQLMSGGVIVALSGGADSVFLLRFLLEYSVSYGFPIACVHVNHGIRGAEADRDEAFCRNLCSDFSVDFEAYHVDIPKISAESGKGLEEAARDERYRILEECRKKHSFTSIAVAHNATDNLETMLFNLVRGSGTRGMCGIAPIRGNIVRPILPLTKKEIEEFLISNGIEYVTDSTNAVTDYSRNYIRCEIVPKLERICSGAIKNAYRTSKCMRSDLDYIERAARDIYSAVVASGIADVAALKALHPALLFRVICDMCRDHGASETPEYVHFASIKKLIARGGAFRVDLPSGVSFISDGKKAKICSTDSVYTSGGSETGFNIPITPGTTFIPSTGGKIILSYDKNREFSNSVPNVYKLSIHANLSSAIIKGNLFVRNKIAGDTYYYGGLTRKVKKLFSDKKLSEERRRTLPILCDDSGIVWIPGFGVREDRKPKGDGPFIIYCE